MKSTILLSLILLSSICFAQSQNTFLLKGNLKNFDKDFFEVTVGGFFNSSTLAVKVDKKGNFSKACTIDGLQEIYIEIGEDYKHLFAAVGDTIILNWSPSTFGVGTLSKSRTQELSLVLKLAEGSDESVQVLNKKLYEKGTADSVKFSMINDLYNAELRFMEKFPLTNYSLKIYADLYFKYASMMRSHKLLNSYKLKNINADSPLIQFYFLSTTLLSEQLFKQSETYRDFIFDQTRFCSPFNSYMLEANNRSSSNFTEKDYYAGKAFLPITSIRDWFLTKAIMNGFEHYNFKDAKAVYDDFILTSNTPAYTDTLKAFYINIAKLAPGQPAPQFTLKDENGNAVSLTDLKGKVVFIDFWGVYCGPCIGDIKDNGAKFHEKYKDKAVVFLNICVDVASKEWKKAIKDLKLEGRNLLAEGWTNNQVCKDYAINAIPHYVLIDHEGNIVNNNAPGMGELLGNEENILDRAISTVK